MKRIGVFPGTFDPFTLGHKSVVEKAFDLFDEIHIVIGVNPDKKCMFSPEVRAEIIKETFPFNDNIKIVFWPGLMIDYCKKVGAKYMIRGIRTGMDFDYENNIKYAEKKINPEIETLYFITDPEYAGVSSSVVRELIKNDHYEDIFKFIHTTVNATLLFPEIIDK
jgi:pantetheine-phosphate adenylyltransferase